MSGFQFMLSLQVSTAVAVALIPESVRTAKSDNLLCTAHTMDPDSSQNSVDRFDASYGHTTCSPEISLDTELCYLL